MTKFFERGNLALDWDFIKYDFVGVSKNGYAFSYKNKPELTCSGYIYRYDDYESLGKVGAPCPDWRELLFERPQAQRLPDGFWEAVDIVYGDGFEWFYFSDGVHPVVSKNPDDKRHELYVCGLHNMKPTFSKTRRPFLRIGQTEADE